MGRVALGGDPQSDPAHRLDPIGWTPSAGPHRLDPIGCGSSSRKDPAESDAKYRANVKPG